jgi:hypothetical protein
MVFSPFIAQGLPWPWMLRNNRKRAFLSHQKLTDEQIRIWPKFKLTPLKTKPAYLRISPGWAVPQASMNKLKLVRALSKLDNLLIFVYIA